MAKRLHYNYFNIRNQTHINTAVLERCKLTPMWCVG